MRFCRKTIVVGSLATVLLAVFPLTARRDSYPHSDLPMFAATRERIARFTTAIALDESGAVRRLDPETIAATDEVIAAQAALVRAVNSGQAETMCSEIAARSTGAVAIRIQTETHDIIDSLDRLDPLDVRVHAQCSVTATGADE